MIAMCAARCGTDASTYFETRTEGQLALDSLAWVHSWATPASALLAGGKEGKGEGPSRPRRPGQRQERSRVNRVNLDEWDTPERIGALEQRLTRGRHLIVPEAGKLAATEAVRARAKRVDATRAG